MTVFVTDRKIITRKILALLGLANQEEEYSYAMKHWWRNLRSCGGLNLTEVGDTKFLEAELEYWDFDLPAGFGTSEAIKYNFFLDRKMPCPYILTATKKQYIFRVYDSRMAVTIGLWGGVDKLLDHYLEHNIPKT